MATWHDVFCLGLRATGVPWFLREVYARHRVTIINYHNPAREVFACHMKAFSRLYSFVGIGDIARALRTRDFSFLPPKPLLVTLDDGHIGNIELLDVLKQYKVPAVIYAVAGVVDTCRAFWFDLLPHGGSVMRKVKCLSDSERRNLLWREYGHTDEKEYGSAAALSRRHLLALIEAGAQIGSHTTFHPLLQQCSDEVGRWECVESRRRLTTLLGEPVEHFALPDGSADERSREWIADAGYTTCRTTAPGWVTPDTDLFTLPNLGIADDAGIHKAIVQASGLWSLIKRLLARVGCSCQGVSRL